VCHRGFDHIDADRFDEPIVSMRGCGWRRLEGFADHSESRPKLDVVRATIT